MFNNNFNHASKNQQSSVKNPFSNEEVLQAWLENDTDYNKAKLEHKKTLQLNNSNKFIMPNNNPYLKFVNFITRHTVTATLIMLLAVGGLSASAAEVFAPTEYKPSTISRNIFSNNQQPDKDPYTALKADSNNEVANLETCDISIKFPKQINNKEVEVYSELRYQGNDLINYFTLIDNYEFTSQYQSQIIKGENPSIAFSPFYLSCKATKTEYGQGYLATKLTTDELRNKTGWLITEAELNNIFEIKSEYGSDSIAFEYRGVNYTIDYANFKNQSLLSGITVNQIQIQFNSLVTNQSTKTVATLPDIAKPNADKPQPTPSKNPINVELENSTNLTKFVNLPDTENLDIDGQPFLCGTQYVTSYNKPTISDKDDFVGMQISNRNLGFDLQQINDYQTVLNLINRKVQYTKNLNSPIPGSTSDSFLSPFASGCAGSPFSYQFLDAPQVNYPNTDSSITLYTLEGNGEIGIPTARIFAKKGDNLITLSATLFSYELESVRSKCLVKNSEFEAVDNICFENLLKSDTQLKSKLDQAAKDLVTTFALKN